MALVAAAAAFATAQSPDPVEPVQRLIRAARFAEAEAGTRRLLAETEATSGADSIQTARVLDALVEALWRGGRVRAPETKALAERALAINEAQLGATHPDVAVSLTTLGIVLRLQGDYASARSRFERALVIQERALGSTHPDVARTVTMSALLATDTGDLSTALALHERALAIRRQAPSPLDEAIAENLNGLGVILERQGDYRGAERYHGQALEIRERALGPAHPDVASSLNNLGNVQSDMGNYAEARALHQRALEIREKALGVDHPDVAASLNNLAVDVRDLGDHAAAWWLLERVLAIYEMANGPDHPTVGFVCHNLATILLDLGDTAGARVLAERARRAHDRDPLRRASLTASLNPLVGGVPPPSTYAAAEALFERALRIKEAALGPRHTSVAVTLTSLANVLTHLKQWDRAEPLYQRALAIREQALGPNHPHVAETLDRLGEFFVASADYGAARPVFERVLAILEQGYGPDHPHVGAVRQHLAELLATTGETRGALQLALETERIGREHLRTIGRTLPEREALMYAAARPAGLDVALTIIASGEGDHASRAPVWDAVVRSRAMVLDEMARRHQRVRGSEDRDVARLVDDLASKREQLARLVVRGPGGPQDQYLAEIAAARDARDAAERALAERSVAFQQEQVARRIGLDEVKAVLPRQSALVAFVRYQRRPLHARTASEEPLPPVATYLAFVIRADSGEPAVVALGPAAAIDSEVARWRKLIGAVAFAGGRSTARAETAVRQAGARLRALVWDPLVSHVGDADRVLIVPDGPLHLVSWDGLPAADGGYLVEHAPPFHYLSAERDLVVGQQGPQGRGLLVVDSPMFDGAIGPAPRVTDSTAARSTGAAARAGSGGFRRSRSGCGDLRSLRFDPLPASAREAQTIATIWQHASHVAGTADVSRLSGRAATEAEVKRQTVGARVLHLATHGFFLGGRCAPALDPAAGTRMHDFATADSPGENPLLLAGFALTGANRRRTAGVEDEDGILTAEEIASLDLGGVEWAVLSACDTGVGEVRAGEGVFGLRRAFHVAGARTVIMSLWAVDDEDSRRWMTSVYERRFRGGAGTMDAVRASTLEQLRRRRRAGLSTHPFYWAAFIAAGDWR